MRYVAFTIKNYRAITEPLQVVIGKNSLVPIIGVNESGKTTILHAVFAFDHQNDIASEGVHLSDTENLYTRNAPNPTVTATIAVDYDEWKESCQVLAREYPALDEYIQQLTSTPPSKLDITRDIKTKKYVIPFIETMSEDVQNIFAHELLTHLPYILFFDDFRDRIPSVIKIPKTPDKSTEWLGFMRQLFRRVPNSVELESLGTMDTRLREGLLSDVRDFLNMRLTDQWKQMRLDDGDLLTVNVDFIPPIPTSDDYGSLELGIIETTPMGKRHFHLENRSKGFYWFFNFVVKLEFNDKATGESGQSAIYLLDEPGSYLHSSAQARLCLKLRDLAKVNNVIYGTHSHYLLHPKVILFKSIQVAEKDKQKCVRLTAIDAYKGPLERKGAFQPVFDALQMIDFELDINVSRILLVEGIYDYYAYSMMAKDILPNLGILPGVNADSVKYHVSEMLLKKKDFMVLWDNDEEGIKNYEAAKKQFGVDLAKRRFRLLPLVGKSKVKCRLEHLFLSADLDNLKQKMSLASNTSFEKTVASWFLWDDSSALADCITQDTRARFVEVFNQIGLGN